MSMVMPVLIVISENSAIVSVIHEMIDVCEIVPDYGASIINPDFTTQLPIAPLV